jgi:FtsZ-interacting cell division protein ZipA
MDDIGTIIFLLLFVFGPLLKKLGEKKNKTGKPSTATGSERKESSASGTEVDPEEELRRFLESLTGQRPKPRVPAAPKAAAAEAVEADRQAQQKAASHPESKQKRPPRPIRQQQQEQPLKPLARPLREATRSQEPLARQRKAKAPKAPRKAAQPQPLAPIADFGSQSGFGSLASSMSPEPVIVVTPEGRPVLQKSNLNGVLRDRRSLRGAIVLSEILGPPRALREWGQDLDR